MIELENVVEYYLEALRTTPAIYVQPVTVDSLCNFLTGLDEGLLIVGVFDRETYYDAGFQAYSGRGWKKHPNIVALMRQSGLTEEKVFEELLLIAIERYRVLVEGREVRATGPDHEVRSNE